MTDGDTMQIRLQRTTRFFLATLATLAISACGDDGGGGTEGAELVVTPANAELLVVNGTPATQNYQVELVKANGSTTDVTDQVTWSLETPQIGSFTSATLTASGGAVGQSLVWADFEDLQGEAMVTVRMETVSVDDSAPANAPDLFDGATDDPASAPSIVYPETGTLFPPNVGTFDVHWTTPGAQDLFELSAQSEYADVTLYTAGTVESLGRWDAFSAGLWNTIGGDAAGSDVIVSLRGLSTADPTKVGSATDLVVPISAQRIEGGIYYWSASFVAGADNGIFRYDMGDSSNTPERFYTDNETPNGRCVGCHAISRNGERIALTMDQPDLGGNPPGGSGSILDVATREPLVTLDTLYWDFATFNPDGSRLLTVSRGLLSLRASSNGQEVTSVTGPGLPTQPDFSPLGDQIVYTRAPANGFDWDFTDGVLITRSFDPVTETFGPEVELLNEAGANVYYPSFSPDGQWIVFSRSTANSYDAPTSEVYVMRADGSEAPVKLDVPNVSSGLTNSWVRWAPFELIVDPLAEVSEPLFWLTFSSKRAFGVRLPQGTPQLWMAPFFPARITTPEVSTPAFRMSFQQTDTGNHIAQWTESVVAID
jgi:hypothetical protein